MDEEQARRAGAASPFIPDQDIDEIEVSLQSGEQATDGPSWVCHPAHPTDSLVLMTSR